MNIQKITATVLIGLFATTPAYASKDTHQRREEINIEILSTDYRISVAAQNLLGAYSAAIYAIGPGININCSTPPDSSLITDPLEVRGSAKHGTLSFNTSELYCQGINPNVHVSARCTFDGNVHEHLRGNHKLYIRGVTYHAHIQSNSSSAECTVQVNGMAFTGPGYLREDRPISRTK